MANELTTSRFRPAYRELNDAEKQLVLDIKTKAEELEGLISKANPGRYPALALTALEESVMWATKAVTT